MTRFVSSLLVSALMVTFAPNKASAQTDAKSAPSGANINQQNVSIELRDAPIRKALERLFDAVKADFMIEETVKAGTVTARLKDKPFETVLKVLLESSSTPLTYERDGQVYIITLKPVPKPTPEPAKIAKAEEKPADGNSEGTENTFNPVEPVDSAPAYRAIPASSGWQVGPGGVTNGQGFPQFANGFAPVGFGAPGFGSSWSGFPANGVFFSSQPLWGRQGGFLRFP